MSELKWKEYEIIECLGVPPKFDEEWLEYAFEYFTDELVLELFIKPYDSFVAMYLRQKSEEKAFLEVSFRVRNEIRYVNEKSAAFLEFSDCVFSNYYHSELFDKKEFSNSINFEIHTVPNFQIKFL